MTPQQAAHYHLLRLIELQPAISQRDLAQAMGVSVGKAHYLLRALLEKGLVKANNFRRSDNKLAYIYLLTPSGIAVKLELTRAFLHLKESEYEAARQEIERLREELKSPPFVAKRYETTEQVHDALCGHIADLAEDAIAKRGSFSIVVTGGATVVPLYRRLACLDTDWSCWRVYWSDERCVPPASEQRNSKLAFDAWLSDVPIPSTQLFPIPAELGPLAGAAQYDRLLSGADDFDLVLLSLGEDGDVASVFSDVACEGAKHVSDAALPVHNAPRPPISRVTLSLSRLARSRSVALVAVGRNKRSAVGRLAQRADQPATRLALASKLELWLDRDAAGTDHGQR